MLSKSEKNWIKSLKDKKTRQENRKFIAEGSKIILDLFKEHPDKLKLLCCTNEWLEKLRPVIKFDPNVLRILSNSELQSVATLKSTEEVLAVFSYPDHEPSHPTKNLIIYLDNITDPGNLGTIIRTADWFGLSQLFCSPGCVDPFNNKCIQATMSSIFRVNIITKTWEEMNRSFEGTKKYAATMNGTSIYDLSKDDVNFVCIGNEANGISEDVLKDCSNTISIPATHSLGAESLNAAIACSLIMAWKTFGK
jgi:TrmH family RNA methyltransferase